MYSRIIVKSQAKQSLNGRWGIAIGTFIVNALIMTAVNVVPGIGQVAAIVLAGVFSVGMSIVYLEIVRNWDCQFEDMFKGFNNFGTNCLAGILTAVYTILWSLLFIIPGIVKSLSYAMTPYILADHPEMSASEAITASRIMMDGNKGKLFVLYLSFIGWGILCIIPFVFLYVTPYMMASVAKFYDTIKDEKNFTQPL